MTSAQTKADDYYNQALSFYTAEKDDDAARLVAKGLEVDPRHVGLIVLRGNLAFLHDRTDDAMADYNTGIQIAPKDPNPWGRRGILKWWIANDAKGDRTAALSDLNMAIKLGTRTADVYFRRAMIEGDDLHQYKRAIADYATVKKLDPKEAFAWHNTGIMYEQLNDNYRAALKEYEEQTAIDPTNETGWRERCHAEVKLNLLDDAIPHCLKAIELNPKDSYPLNEVAWAYHLKGDHDNTLKYVARALEIDPRTRML